MTAWRGAAILILLLLQGCGFHLRGEVARLATIGPVYIDAAPRFQGTRAALDRALAAHRIATTDAADAARVVVHLENDTTGRRVLSFTDNGTPVEYELRYTLTFRLSGDGAPDQPQTLVLLEDYFFDPNRLLSQSNEEALLGQEMRRQAAYLIVQRLRALPPPKSMPDISPHIAGQPGTPTKQVSATP